VADYIASPECTWDRYCEKAQQLPPMYAYCGMQDPSYERMLEIEELVHEKNVKNARFVYEPGYGHVWECWDRAIQQALEFWGI